MHTIKAVIVATLGEPEKIMSDLFNEEIISLGNTYKMGRQNRPFCKRN